MIKFSSDDEETDQAFREYLKSGLKSCSIQSSSIKLTKKQAAIAFEAEMNAELDDMVESKEKSFFEKIKPKERKSNESETKPSTSRSAEAKNKAETQKQGEEEEEEDSDTDSEAELATGVRTKKKRKHYTNDELFYDPEADEEDAKWVAEKRSPVVSGGQKTIKSILKKPTTAKTASQSDAVLNCPCCMNMLTMDCQRYY